MSISNVGSGIANTEEIKFSLLDYDNQIMVHNNVSQITITPVNSPISSVAGTYSEQVKSGVATFDNLIAISPPGSSNVQFRASSKAISNSKIIKAFGSSINNNTISMNFRDCKPGEYILGNTCGECTAGLFSLKWNSLECTPCIDNAVCLGKDQISVRSGYWRRTANSTKLIECINQDA